jgi:hypothetical protein
MPAPIRKHISRTADRCYAAFCDARRLTEWVPGLRRARVVLAGEDGRPREVLFEFGDKLTYSLIYHYDEANRRVEWRPGLGRRDAVTGFAAFADTESGCEMTYVLASAAAEQVERGADAEAIASAFAEWVAREPESKRDSEQNPEPKR